MSDELFHPFGRFYIDHLLYRLSLEKQYGVFTSYLILSLCLFHIVNKSFHCICKHKIYELSHHGKNFFFSYSSPKAMLFSCKSNRITP